MLRSAPERFSTSPFLLTRSENVQTEAWRSGRASEISTTALATAGMDFWTKVIRGESVSANSMVTLIKKAPPDHRKVDGPRGFWWPLNTSEPGKYVIVCSCPGCGETWGLHGWTIYPNGDVTPSVDHSMPIRKTDPGT